MDSNLDCLTLQNISKMDINQDFAQKYLEYLVTLIHLNKPIDFIQAALIMQTLSSVFAKKVDNLQEQIHAFIVLFRKLELGNGSAIEDNDDAGCDENQANERARVVKKKLNNKEILLHSFENICDLNNIRKSNIKSWNDKSIKQVDPYSIRNRINECPKLKIKENFSCYIYDNKEEILGKKEEFGVNGIICNDLIPKDNCCLQCSHSKDFSKFENSNISGVTDIDFVPVPLNHDSDHDLIEPIQNEVNNMEIENNDDNEQHCYRDVVEDYINNSTTSKDDTYSGYVYFKRMNTVQEALVDVEGVCNMLWSPVNDDNVLLEKQIETRNVKSIPEDLRKMEDRKLKINKNVYPTDYVLPDLILAIYKLKSSVPLHPQFIHSLRLEKENRDKKIKKRSRRRNQNIVDARPDDFRGFNEFGDDGIDTDFLDNDNDFGGDLYSNDVPENGMDVEQNEDGNYMLDAIRHIREYQQEQIQNTHDDTINEIACKVSAWHDNIRPVLEREEKRVCFDIHEYGSKILQHFPSNPAKKAKTTISFASIVRDQPRDEIPRFFLSSLLLANSHNIEISKSCSDELTVNDMTITFLDHKRQYEVLDEGMRKDFS